MRCPKCGYISYDRLERCAKCKSDLTAISQKLQGTTLNVEAPSFLAMTFGGAVEEQMAVMDEADDAPVYLEEDEISVSLDEEEGGEEEIEMLPTGLQDIDVSDLVPLEDEEEPSVETEGSISEETESENAERGEGIPFAGISAASLLAPEEGTPEAERTEKAVAVATVEDEVVDLSDLMSGTPEQLVGDSGNDLTLDLTLANDSEDDISGQEEINFDLEGGLQGVTDFSLEPEKKDGEDAGKLSDHDLDLKLEMDDDHV